MFQMFTHFLRGYLVMAVSGFSAERFINLAVNRGVCLRNVQAKSGRILFTVSLKDFRRLHPCARKCGCKLKIIKKAGLPFIIHRYRKRKPLILGMLVFVGLIYYLTSFIWLVTIEGNDRIETQALTQALADMDVAPGRPGRGLRLRLVEQGLMQAFPDIAWVNLSVTGTRAALTIVETLPKQEPVDRSVPMDVVAAKDGVIESIATETGRPLVKPGDVVRAGDVLVSGELLVGNEEYGYQSYYVRASSQVFAKRYYEYVFEVPLTYTVKSFTGNIKRNYGIILFDKPVYLENSESPFECYDRVTEENRLRFGEDYPLPVVYFVEKYKEFVPVTARRSLEEAEIMGRTIVGARILRELPAGTEVMGVDISYEATEETMVVTAFVTVIERIGEERPGIRSPEPEGEP